MYIHPMVEKVSGISFLILFLIIGIVMWSLYGTNTGTNQDEQNAFLGSGVAFTILFVFVGIIMLVGTGRIREEHIQYGRRKIGKGVHHIKQGGHAVYHVGRAGYSGLKKVKGGIYEIGRRAHSIAGKKYRHSTYKSTGK